MKPRVLLCNLPYVIKHIDATRPKVRSFYAFPYGLLSVASYCKDLAEIKVLDLGNHSPDAAIQVTQNELEDFQPEIVGFSMGYDNSYGCLEDLAGIVKDYDPNILVVLGGSAASYNYQEILEEQEDIDAVCFGGGEIPFKALLDAGDCFWGLALFAHPSWMTRDKITCTPVPTFIQNLDEVIDIDYSFVNPADYQMQEAFSPYARPNRKCFFLMTSRGCFGACSFCSNSAIHGKKVRQASVERIVAHVRYLVEDYGMETLIIYDDCLLWNKKRAKELFRQLAQFKIRIECPNGLNVAFIDEELAGLMASAGVDTAYLAVESGSEFVLKELIHKPLKLSMVKPAVKWLQDAGVFVHVFIVWGMPGETDVHRQETEDFLMDLGANWVGVNLATPVKGSALYDACLKNGWIAPQKIKDVVDKKYVINYPGEDPAKIERQAQDLNVKINFHHNKDMRDGNYERAAACFRQVIERYEGHELAKKCLAICEKKLLDKLT